MKVETICQLNNVVILFTHRTQRSSECRGKVQLQPLPAAVVCVSRQRPKDCALYMATMHALELWSSQWFTAEVNSSFSSCHDGVGLGDCLCLVSFNA